MLTPRPHRFLINRSYARLWYGQAISTVGDFVFSTSLVLWVATVLAEGRPWAPAAVSGVVLAVGIAVLGVGPLAGVFVDRWDPVRTMLGTEVIRAALVALLTVVSFLPVHAIPTWLWLILIYVVVAALNAVGQFFGPARFSTIRDIVTGEADRTRAAGIAQATSGMAAIVGPPLAAPLLFGLGLQWALLVNVVSYVVSYLAIRSARHEVVAARTERVKGRAGLGRELTEGIRFFAGSRFLVALLILAVIGQLGTGTLTTLNVFFVTGNLHAPSDLYGYFGTAIGAGGIVGALCAGRAVAWVGARRATWIGLVLGGVLLFVYSRQTTVPAGLTMIFLLIVPITILNMAMSPLLLAAAPKEYSGRVFAVFYPVTRLASMLAATAAGAVVSAVPSGAISLVGMRFGPVDVTLAVAAALIVLAGGYARFALPGEGESAR